MKFHHSLILIIPLHNFFLIEGPNFVFQAFLFFTCKVLVILTKNFLKILSFYFKVKLKFFKIQHFVTSIILF